MSDVRTQQVDLKLLDRPDVPTRTFRAGDVIAGEGEAAREMFVVRSGRVSISVHGQPVEEVGAGGMFGEMALIDRAPRSATVVAAEDTVLVVIGERLFVVLVQETPFFALDVMRVLVDRIRLMNARL